MSKERLTKFLETLRTLVKEAKKEFPTFEFNLIPAPCCLYLELNIITDSDWGKYDPEFGLIPNDSGIYKKLNDLLRFDSRMLDLEYKTNCMRYKPNELTMEYFVFD